MSISGYFTFFLFRYILTKKVFSCWWQTRFHSSLYQNYNNNPLFLCNAICMENFTPQTCFNKTNNKRGKQIRNCPLRVRLWPADIFSPSLDLKCHVILLLHPRSSLNGLHFVLFTYLWLKEATHFDSFIYRTLILFFFIFCSASSLWSDRLHHEWGREVKMTSLVIEKNTCPTHRYLTTNRKIEKTRSEYLYHLETRNSLFHKKKNVEN